MLLALVACVCIDVGCRIALPPSGAVTRNSSERTFLAQSETPDVQIIGDSVAYFGLISSALVDDPSIYVRNDALSGSLLPYSYYVLRREFEAGRIPRAVVLAHSPFGFGQPAIREMAATFLDWEELADLALDGEWQQALYGALARSSYILMNRQSFRNLLMSGDWRFFATPTASHVHKTVSDVDLLETYRTNATAKRPVDGWKGPTNLEALHQLAIFRVRRETDRYFRKLLALAKEYDVPVFWITLPVSSSIRESLRDTHFEEDLSAYLARFERSGDLIVLERSLLAYDDRMFADEIHPTVAVTVRFSCELRKFAAELDAQLARHPASRPAVLTPARAAALAEQVQARSMLAALCEPVSLSSTTE